MTPVSGNMRYMRTFVRVPLGGVSNDCAVIDDGNVW